MLDNILTTQEGPKILKTQRQKLIEDSTLIRKISYNPHMLLQKQQSHEEESMSVDEEASTVSTKNVIKSHLKFAEEIDESH
jgi:hypothetical protein